MKKLKTVEQLSDRQVGDLVAYEILHQEKKEKKIIVFFLILFILMVFFFSYFLFSKITAFGRTDVNYIEDGSILFSYEEGINGINLVEALPTNDSIGKTMNKEGEYFVFRVAAEINSDTQTTLTYEISLTPEYGTLDPKYVRVYLLEDNKAVLVNNKDVNSFNELKNSTIRENAKFLYKKSFTGNVNSLYTFRMWLRSDYELPTIPQTFKCYVNVDAY